jgi:hypothetical protein
MLLRSARKLGLLPCAFEILHRNFPSVTAFTEAPRDNSYTHHTGHSPDLTGGRSPATRSRQARDPLDGFANLAAVS